MFVEKTTAEPNVFPPPPSARCDGRFRSEISALASLPASYAAWIECESCGRIDKAAHDFNYPADIAEGMELFVWLPCEQCGPKAKLHLQREVKPAH